MKPRFEDAFIDRMGGGPGGESVLAQHVREIPGDGSIVIEADELTKKFGDFTATDAGDLPSPPRRNLRPARPERRGQVHHLQDDVRPAQTDLRTGDGRRTRPPHSAGKARQRLGYMAQKFSLYGNLTVRQNLEFFSGVYGLTGARQHRKTAKMAEIFHLEPFLKAKTDSLPLGFKQRLALACAVMHEPDILFLDEPTSGVDPVTRREFWTHINGLVERGVTVMVTTHFMDEAEYCDRIGLVFRGPTHRHRHAGRTQGAGRHSARTRTRRWRTPSSP